MKGMLSLKPGGDWGSCLRNVLLKHRCSVYLLKIYKNFHIDMTNARNQWSPVKTYSLWQNAWLCLLKSHTDLQTKHNREEVKHQMLLKMTFLFPTVSTIQEKLSCVYNALILIKKLVGSICILGELALTHRHTFWIWMLCCLGCRVFCLCSLTGASFLHTVVSRHRVAFQECTLSFSPIFAATALTS